MEFCLGVLTEKRDALLQKELETALAVRLKGKERICVVDAAQAAGRKESSSAEAVRRSGL